MSRVRADRCARNDGGTANPVSECYQLKERNIWYAMREAMLLPGPSRQERQRRGGDDVARLMVMSLMFPQQLLLQLAAGE
ncbi:hypothetical protein Dda_6495 [Drechslerella dactyloides]|uniref:Uncharacterized protein n=1 Tax=Drechslerella dactyloides TaxID=74499 RepID=A0AAD6IUV7_DREDA|nr:hypothetical protein Dda_6495 [Drechslerella dactyloides]